MKFDNLFFHRSLEITNQKAHSTKGNTEGVSICGYEDAKCFDNIS